MGARGNLSEVSLPTSALQLIEGFVVVPALVVPSVYSPVLKRNLSKYISPTSIHNW